MISQVESALLNSGSRPWILVPVASLKSMVRNFKPPPKFDDVEFPTSDKRRLRILEKVPHPINPTRGPLKMPKRLIDMRGPELIHNKLIHKQYGIQALTGGAMKHGHLEMMRLRINRRMDESRMFAIWRIDAPWKAVTRKGQGHRMGGGKGNIDHYVTPVKANRIIVELAGNCEFQEVEKFLTDLANKLPFPARSVSQEILDKEEEMEAEREKRNVNPLTFKYLLDNNFCDIKRWCGPYDYKWFGKYR